MANGKNSKNGKNGKKAEVQLRGRCKKCSRLFLKSENKCACQDFLCYRCCQCDVDCAVCNCKIKRKFDIRRKSRT